MKDMKQILVVGIILLFIGVAVAPSINPGVVTASFDDDLVEVTTQACGIQGYKDTTVKLTREQYQNLEEYLVEFRARLNQTTTKEEAVPIFKEAVVELDKYGLLPRGMSVERAQRLVSSEKLNPLDISLRKHLKVVDNSTLINSKCLVFSHVEPIYGFMQWPLLIWLGLKVGFIPLFPDIFIFFYCYCIMLRSLVPVGISLLSVMEFSGDGTIHSFGRLGKVYDKFNNEDMLLFGFVGLRYMLYNFDPFSDEHDKGFQIGWSREIYHGYPGVFP